jgi:hypothetical protein
MMDLEEMDHQEMETSGDRSSGDGSSVIVEIQEIVKDPAEDLEEVMEVETTEDPASNAGDSWARTR